MYTEQNICQSLFFDIISNSFHKDDMSGLSKCVFCIKFENGILPIKFY